MSEPVTEVLDDAETLATTVATRLLERLADAQAAGEVPQIALTGGSIAEAIHREVARLSPASGVDWGAVVVWFGDERFVEAASPDRNARQAREAFLDAVGATRVHEVPSSDDGDLEHAAQAYGDALRAEGSGSFEVTMLGVGPDGHVASLFPGYPQLDVDDRIAVAVTDSPKPPPQRVSLTFPALNRSRSVWFLVAGEAKADAVARAHAGSPVVETPASGVTGERETLWFLDRAAASQLPTSTDD